MPAGTSSIPSEKTWWFILTWSFSSFLFDSCLIQRWHWFSLNEFLFRLYVRGFMSKHTSNNGHASFLAKYLQTLRNSEWIFVCFLNLHFKCNHLLQFSHLNSFSFLSMCVFSSQFFRKVSSHSLHLITCFVQWFSEGVFWRKYYFQYFQLFPLFQH